MILLIKTDQPQSYVALYEGAVIQDLSWDADRLLSDELLKKIETLLQHENSTWGDLSGIVVYRGPGSFTGLRIGITVANTLSHSERIPLSGTSGSNWIEEGVQALDNSEAPGTVIPVYGGVANITKPRK